MESQFTNNQGNEYTYYSYTPDLTVENIPDPDNYKYGLKRAIIAKVLSTVAAFVGIAAMYLILFSMYGFAGEAEEVGASVLFFGFFLTAGCVVMAIVSLVLGIRSIKCFKQKAPRPIATLILGISSVVDAASALELAMCNAFFMFLALIIAATAMI